jgi:hypothetical protein
MSALSSGNLNRREWIAGAAALVGHSQLPSLLCAAPLAGASAISASAQLPPKPANLLSTSFSPELLRGKLLSATEWKPFPRFADRAAWAAIPKDTTKAILAAANSILGTPWSSLPASIFLDFARNGNRSRFEALNFERRGRLSTFVLAECMEAKGRFLDEIANGIWLVCEETFWGVPAHLSLQKKGVGLPDVTEPVVDLFAAQTSATLSWVHYLLASELARISPLLPERIVIEAKRRILNPAFERDDFWWMWKGNHSAGSRLNNWNPWINSNLLVTNLLLEHDAERRVAAIAKICRSTDAFLADYSPDAACEEGPAYWGESGAAYFDICKLLVDAVPGAPNVLVQPFIRRMMHYIADAHIAGRYAVDFGDCSPLSGAPGALAYQIGKATGDAELQGFGAATLPHTEAEVHGGAHSGITRRDLTALFQLAEARTAPAADALSRDSWYPSLCLMTARQKADTTDGFYMALQAAPNLRSHGHNDSGSFIVFHNGEPVFIDAGTQAYTAQTFSKDRYKIWIMQSGYHNLPTVGGQMQTTGELRYRATDAQYATSNLMAQIALNLAPAYPDEAGIRHWTRTLTLDRRASRIRLNEEFALAKTVPIVLNFLTPRTPDTSRPGTLLLPSPQAGGEPVSLLYDAQTLQPSIEKIDLTDNGLKTAWGQLYRVQLTSAAVASGNWSLEIA